MGLLAWRWSHAQEEVSCHGAGEDETYVPLLKWIKNDPDEAAVRTMVPAPSSENLYKHKATGQLGGTLFSKQTETAKPSLVKRIATPADEASADTTTKLLSAPPSGCVYKLKSKDQPGHHGAPINQFNQFLEKEKLKSNGCNFTDWFRHVRIFLNGGNLQYVLEAPLGSPPPSAVSEEEKNVFENRVTRYSQVQCAILCSLEAELQKRFEHHDPCEMIRELKVIFETHAAVESYEASKQFFGCMMEEGSSVSEHVFAMSGHARKLSDLGIMIPNQLGIHRVLQSLPPSYKNFVMNYNMQNMNKELPELFSMLKSAEVEIQKEHQVLMVNKTTSFKKQGKPKKGNFKKGGKKAAAPPEKPKGGPKPDTDCYYCNGKGHWKRNFPKYLADLKSGLVKKKKETVAFTLNRAPSKSVETTLYELWFQKKPKLSFLKVWGCEAYVKKLQPDKIEPKAEKCVFIGYPKETIGYTFYHRSEGKIFVAKNGTFLEKEFLTKEVTGRKVELDEVIEPSLVDQSSAVPEDVLVPPAPIREEASDNDHETSNEVTTEPRKSTRERTTPDWYDPCLNVMIVDNNDEDPATYEEAMMSPDSNKWQETMKSEMGSMYDNKVWTLVDLPDSRKAVENKWIFKRKTDADGNITVYKARLIAKGFRQIQGVDYDETFSPVAKLKSVRILLAIAAFFDYEIWQMDVKTAFLNGDIEEELYMVQPKGFVDPKNADKVCKLQRSIYGLKQASRSWNRRFDKVIKDFGFIQTHGEACIYKKSGYVFILNGAAVSWCSSKQCTVAKSSTESEYIAASEASSEAVWMKRFIVELGVVPSALDPLVIYCDNMGAIANAQEPRSPDGTGTDVTKGTHTSTGTDFPLSCISTGSCTSPVYCIYPAGPYISIGSGRGPIYYTCPAGSCISTGSSRGTVYCTCPTVSCISTGSSRGTVYYTCPTVSCISSSSCTSPGFCTCPSQITEKLPKSISKDLNVGRRGKISLVMESEGLTVEGRLGEALQEFLLHLHHHAVVLLGFRGDLPHSAARWNGEGKGFIDTVRATEYGSAAGLQHWMIVYTNNEI
ncbi:hypothetical protein QYE76_033308 [Lolium multiflorum]|uniref:Retrotransposon protein, putative, Ty1-copia subclass n=1 Tax=Lolium multiflorum TaxID=4521 RepID=A0AAD8VM06_LOLMU|nr:hypothetical protein QYE76_033308 [Lolium multiflorum]